MEQLILGLYVLSLLACVLCLWFWYELENQKDRVTALRYRIASLDERIDALEKRKR